MRLKYKTLLLAVAPLLVSLALIAWAVQREQASLAERRRLQVRTAFMIAKQEELRHYVALALSTVSPLYNQNRDDEEIKQQVMQRLANLDYGPDGYFFLYSMDGVNLMHPRQPELVGRNLIELRDAGGEPTIRMLLERARSGGGFVVYHWRKPSSEVETAKLGYVTVLERWGWMIGTGLYLDDIDDFMRVIDDELERTTHTTLLWIAGTGGLGVALLFGCMLLLGFSEIKVSDAKLKLLARKVVTSQEEERAHLSRELHDGTGQTLVAVKLLIESALDRLEGGRDVVKAPLTRALERLKEALVEVRGMSHRLRPVMLDTLGLPAALQSLGEETCGESGTAFTMEVEGDEVELPEAVKTVLFRITQEALTNIQKHAGRAHVGLRLSFGEAGLHLSIHDDGRGFDVQSVREDPRRGIGLRNMRERIESVGGTLSVQSQPGLTRITAGMPYDAIRRF
ncbi:MAG: cache domain-containing protein, partial [Gammaproteobacteria bacterium]|nr:cache domain-containing protein [Gammaproteobacteria bacterium]